MIPLIPGNSLARQPSYRSDIDGLRAIAVISVIAFHAFPSAMPGGFIGVDVFFVISGFLISSIIYSGLEQGRFSLLDFYSRRIRRIFPALLLVLIACIVVGWKLLLAGEYALLGQHVAAGAGFVSNLVLWSQSGYFDTASELKPLLHLWSLGIEEQFYIFWPLLMWLAMRLQIRFGTLAFFVFFISFILNITLVDSDAVSAFYLPYCRIWELVTGGLVMLFKKSQPFPYFSGSNKAMDLASGLGLLLLLFGMFFLEKGVHFPGWWALLPTIGAALLLSATGSKINKYVLSQPILVGIGLISYPLYLWHWPLLSFGQIATGGDLNIEIRLWLVATAVVLAYVTYRYLEHYLRHQAHKAAFALAVLMLLVGLTGWNIFSREGLDFRYRKIIKQSPEMMRDFTKWEDKGMYPVGVCEPGFVFPNALICLETNSNAKPDTVIFGDSHAFHAYWGLARTLEKSGHHLKLIGRGGCTFGLYPLGSDCEQTFQRQVEWMVADNTVKDVFIVHRLVIKNESDPNDVETYKNRINDMLSRLIQHGKHVIYFQAVPEARIDPKLCGGELPYGRKADLSACNFPLKRELEYQRANRQLMEIWSENYSNLKVFDPSDLLCHAGLCQTIINGRTNWMDDNHLSESASYLQGDAVVKIMGVK